MNHVSAQRLSESVETMAPKGFYQITNELCEEALDEAKAQLHPLIRNVELDRLDQRMEFVNSFKLALERRLAQVLAAWNRGRLQIRRVMDG